MKNFRIEKRDGIEINLIDDFICLKSFDDCMGNDNENKVFLYLKDLPAIILWLQEVVKERNL